MSRFADAPINASSSGPAGRHSFTVPMVPRSNVSTLSRLRPDRRDAVHVLLLLSMPGIVGRLHMRLHIGAVSEQLAQTHRDGRRDRLAFAQDVGKALARNAE